MARPRSIAWRKIRGDLRLQRARVITVMLAVAVGTAALATALGARTVLHREIAASFASALPPQLTITTADATPAVLDRVRAVPGVVAADARRVVRARVRVGGEPGRWLPLALYGVRDFADLEVSAVTARTGAFPPAAGELELEQSAVDLLGARVGGALTVRVAGHTATIRVSGIVHDPAQAPAWQDHVGYAYVAPATLAALGVGAQLDEIRIRTHVDRDAVARAVAAALHTGGVPVDRVVIDRDVHPHAAPMGILVTLLTVFGVLALGLAGALTTTVIAFVLARAAGEIATIKTLGATGAQVAWLYLRFVLVIAIPAVVAGVAIGAVAASAFEDFAAGQCNLAIGDRSVPAGIIALELALGLAVPVIAAAPHIVRATMRTVRGALVGSGPSARRSRSRGLVFALAWRGAVRHRGRAWATLGALAIGGAALITAGSVHAGLLGTLDSELGKRGHDLEVRLQHPVPAAALAAAIAAVPGVQRAEIWGATSAAVELPTGQSERYSVLAPPPDARALPVARAGRWLDGAATDEIVVSRRLLATQRELRLGGTAVLIGVAGSARVRVVGVVEELEAAAIYASPGVVATLLAAPGTAGAVRIAATTADVSSVADAVEDALDAHGWFTSSVLARQTFRDAMADHFTTMLTLLIGIAMSAVVLGALTLASSTALDVLERSRELAVMRALGASVTTARRVLLLGNALVVGAAAALAIAIALPLILLIQTGLAMHALFVPVPFVWSPAAIGGWLALSAVILVVGCVIPARRARFAPVQDVLAQS